MKLGDVLSVKHGYAFKSQFFSEAGPYVLLTPGSFYEEGGFRDQADKTKYYTGDFDGQWILGKGDLIVAMTEQAEGLLGSSALIPEPNKYLHNQRLGLITGIDDSQADRNYLYYLFNTREVRAQISASASGTKVRHTSPSRICQVDVDLPPVSIQRRIADILSAYDDLIENNRRRIALLEEAARMIYREWFVRLRFPGYETVRIIDGVPEGWEKTTAYEVMDILSGGTPKTDVTEFWDGDIPFYTPKDAPEYCYVLDTERHITDSGLKRCNSRLYPKNTVFISARGTVGKLKLAQRPMAMSQSCYALVGKHPLTQHFLYSAVLEGIDHLKQQAAGAVFDAIIVDTFKRIPFLMPCCGLLEDYEQMVQPIFKQIENVMLQNQRLQQARDILLPKLMSGEIEVMETADTIEKELAAVQ